MSVLRSCLFAVLAVLLLPWGAYGATYPSAPHAAVSEYADPIQPTAFVSAKKKCRIATLPGSPCGPDIMVREISMTFSTPEPVYGAHFRDVWRGASLAHAPPRDPPRFS
ncbi:MULTISPECIES: hypothetical protein [Halocynthiibacter]|uniref:hypothetical protein n=1 Tax=Halocynthiibacter TaxID=1579315 RepID=UPI0021F1222C|nr:MULTISPECIES: hypothetical protein [Halocynthiibacter]